MKEELRDIYMQAEIPRELPGLVEGALRRGAGGADSAGLGSGGGRGAPLPLIFGEEGEGCGPYFACVAGGVLDAARGAYVCSEKFHTCRVYDFIRTNVTIL